MAKRKEIRPGVIAQKILKSVNFAHDTRLLVAFDNSGSIIRKQHETFNELVSCLIKAGAQADTVCFGRRVAASSFKQSPGFVCQPMYSLGGTNFNRIVEWYNENLDLGYSALIILTDGGASTSSIPGLLKGKRIWVFTPDHFDQGFPAGEDKFYLKDL